MDDEPTLQKMIARLALDLAREQFTEGSRRTAKVRNELIRMFVDTYQKETGDKLDEVIVPAAAKHFKTSKKTVWNALTATKPKMLQ